MVTGVRSQMRFSDTRPARPLSIRLTPLIDVVFILLIFFMLTTRLLPVSSLTVNAVKTRGETTEQLDQASVTILTGGRFDFQDRILALDSLIGVLTDKGLKKVNLIGGEGARLTDFTSLYTRLAAKGFEPVWQRNDSGPSSK